MTIAKDMQDQLKIRLLEAQFLQEKYARQSNLPRSELWRNCAAYLRRSILATKKIIILEQAED